MAKIQGYNYSSLRKINIIRAIRNHLSPSEMCQLLWALTGPGLNANMALALQASHIMLVLLHDANPYPTTSANARF